MESETPLTAAELRERRRQRILENSENRMNKILSGPNGDEKRSAPAMEGGEALSFVSSLKVDNNETVNRVEEKTVPADSFVLSLRKRKEILSLVFGLLFKVLTIYTEGFNAIIPFALCFLTLEYMTNTETPNKVSAENMQVLLSILPPGRRQYAEHLPLVISTIPRFMQDTVTMIGGFLLLHIPFIVISS